MIKAIGRISIAFFHIPLYCRKILVFRSSSQAKKPQSRRKPRASLRPHVSAGCVSDRCKYAQRSCKNRIRGYRIREYRIQNTRIQDTEYENTGYENTGYEDTGYEDTGYEDTG